MSDWFSPETARYFSFFSLMSLLAVMSHWVRQGRHRAIVIGSFVASISLGTVLLLAAVIAWLVDQPPYVIRPMALSGFVITVVFAGTINGVRKSYAEADQRRILAKDI